MSVIRSITRDLLGSLTRNIIVETIASAAAAILDSLQTESNGMVLHFESDTALVRDTGTPANDYNDSFNTEAADFLTYTSPSPKMVLQADGTLKFAAHNLYLNSATPATQSITVLSGHPYKLIVTGTTSITVSGAGTGTATAGSPVTFTAGTTTATLTLNSGTGTAQFGFANRVETYLETTGSARYALPIEYDSAGVSKGVLSEPAATNLVPYSKDLTLSFAENAAKTLVEGTQLSPNGVDYMWELGDNSAGGTGGPRVEFNTTTTSGNTYTFSVYAKQKQLSWIYVFISVFTTNGGVYFDLGTGTAGTEGAGYTGKIEPVGDGIYRCSVTFTATATGSGAGCDIYLADSDGDLLVDLDGTSDIYWSDPQLEVGSTATSYIPTYGSTVTRAKDQITLATSAFPYSDTAGSIITSVDWKILSSSNIAYSLNDGTNTNRFLLYGATNDTAINSGGGLVQLNTDVFNAGADSDIHGVSVGSGSVSATANGVAVVSGSIAMPIGVTTFSIGMSRSNVQQLNGHFKYIKYLPRAIEDAELITDTTA